MFVKADRHLCRQMRTRQQKNSPAAGAGAADTAPTIASLERTIFQHRVLTTDDPPTATQFLTLAPSSQNSELIRLVLPPRRPLPTPFLDTIDTRESTLPFSEDLLPRPAKKAKSMIDSSSTMSTSTLELISGLLSDGVSLSTIYRLLGFGHLDNNSSNNATNPTRANFPILVLEYGEDIIDLFSSSG
jgi:hypothetical protein